MKKTAPKVTKSAAKKPIKRTTRKCLARAIPMWRLFVA